MDFSILTDFIDEFSKWLAEAGKRQRTIEEYLATVMVFYAWFIHKYHMHVRPDQVRAKHIMEWHNEMLHIQKLSPATIHKRLVSLKSYWNFLMENHIVSHNPLQEIRIPKRQTVTSPHSWLTHEEEKRLIERVQQEKNSWKRNRNLCIVRLMLNAGCTVTETVQLEWDQIDRNNDLMRIKGEDQAIRSVPINEPLAQALREWASQSGKQEGPVILSQHDGRMTRQGIHYLVKKYLQDIGLGQYSAHTLRHTFCRRLIEANVGLKEVSKLAGHASMETTKRYI